MTIATPNGDVGPIGAEVDEFLEPTVSPPPPRRSDSAPALQTTVLGVADRKFADGIGVALARAARSFPPTLTSAFKVSGSVTQCTRRSRTFHSVVGCRRHCSISSADVRRGRRQPD